MAEYTKEQMKQLRERWKEYEDELEALIPVIRTDSKWEESDQYRVLIDALGPLPEGVEDVYRDLRGAPLGGKELSRTKFKKTNLTWLIISNSL